MRRSPRLYGEDLAFIHDRGFGDFARRSAPGLLGLLRRCGVRDGLVFDIGCGSGIWARALTDANYAVRGVDRSAAMIALARRRAPDARFSVGSFWSLKIPRCDAVTAIGEVLAYRGAGEPARTLVPLFGRIHRALRPGGVFVFDVTVSGGGASRSHVDHASGKDWAVLFEAEEDRLGRELVRRITSFRRIGSRYRRSEETHRVRLFRTSALMRQIRSAGFAPVRLPGYGRGMRFGPGRVGILARRG